MLETLIMGVLVVAYIIFVGFVLLLLFSDVQQKFDEVQHKDIDEVGFTVAESMANGNHNLVQGVFNKRTNQVRNAHKWEAENLDSRLSGYHRHHKVVIYS